MSSGAPAGISDSVVLMAGAASGIGRAAALRLGARGVQLALLDRDVEALHGLGAELPDALLAVADTLDRAAVAQAVEAVLLRFGRLDALVNSVGITGVAGLRSHEVDPGDFDRVVDVNLRAAFALTQAVLPVMLHQQYGRILHVASIAGKEGNAGMVAYSASKAGLIGMVKAQGKEYAGDGITVNALAPAVIHTPLVAAMSAEQTARNLARIPMNRAGTLDEAAAAVEYAISPETSFCTAFTFDLSGGRATY